MKGREAMLNAACRYMKECLFASDFEGKLETNRLQRTLAEDPPAAYLFFPEMLVGVNRRIRDALRPSGATLFDPPTQPPPA